MESQQAIHADEDVSELDNVELEARVDEVHLEREVRKQRSRAQTQLNPERHGQPAIVFKDLGYRVNIKKWKRGGRFCGYRRETKEKVIIDGVNGALCFGEVVALMGGSGAGKSTLLDLLACRKDANNVLGEIRYEGLLRRRLLSSDAGYVVQGDMAMPNLTVFETLMYAADFQVTVSREEKANIINELLRELRLEHVSATRVGSSLDRGISGGEFRRLTIAEQLLTSPKMLFLDEPTSGLDSASAMVVISMLRKLARRRNQLIVVSIHQPSPALLKKFDSVVVLAKSKADSVGRVIYFGPIRSLPSYPPSVGIEVPPQFDSNVLELLMEISTRQHITDAASTVELEEVDDEDDEDDGDNRGQHWVCPDVDLNALWNESPAGTQVRDRAYQYYQSLEGASHSAEEHRQHYPTSRFTQVKTFAHRLAVNTYRQPGFVIARFGVPHIVGAFVSSLYARIGTSAQDIQNTSALVFFSLLVCFLMSQVYLPLFIVLRPLVTRERQGRLYGASALVLGTLLPNVPIEIFNFTAFATYVYWIVGLRIDGWYWFCWVVNLNGTGLLCMSLMLMVSSFAPTQEVALAIAPILVMFWLMFSGFFVLVDTIPVWYRYWAPYISPLRYSLATGMYTQFHGVTYEGCSSCSFSSGAEVLDYYGVPIGNDAGMWGYMGIVYLFAAFFLICVYFINRFKKWHRG